MAVPKQKTGRARTHSRRSMHDKAAMPARSTCPQCGAVKLPHRVCSNCGYYGGKDDMREVLSVE
jgi:large subunit ribosomal protein L32